MSGEKLSMLKNGALHQLTTGPATVAPPHPNSEYRVLAGLSTFESHIGHFVGCFFVETPLATVGTDGKNSRLKKILDCISSNVLIALTTAACFSPTNEGMSQQHSSTCSQ